MVCIWSHHSKFMKFLQLTPWNLPPNKISSQKCSTAHKGTHITLLAVVATFHVHMTFTALVHITSIMKLVHYILLLLAGIMILLFLRRGFIKTKHLFIIWVTEFNFLFKRLDQITRVLRAHTPRTLAACTAHIASAVSYNLNICCRRPLPTRMRTVVHAHEQKAHAYA